MSWEAISDLDLDLPETWSVRRRQLPVDWDRGPKALRDLIDDTIGAVLCFGMCAGDQIRPERLAVNLNNRMLQDARKSLPRSDHLVEHGPPAYWSALDYPSLIEALRLADLPTIESRDAGGFLCNAVFYTLMHEREFRRASFPAGFIHLPHFEPEGGLALETLKVAAGICIGHAIGLASRMRSIHKTSSATGSDS
jgi:pyroglutamyl-peptidase